MPVDFPGKLSPYTGTKQTDSLSGEDINEVILRLLGLEDTFDIDYDTYKTLLKQKLIENQILTSKGKAMPSEEVEILTEELKRVKGKVGRFTIKRKKITAESFKKPTDTPTGQGAKTAAKILLGGVSSGKAARDLRVDKEDKKEESQNKNFTDSLKNIADSLKNIVGSLKDQFKQEKKKTEKDRQEKQRTKRSKEEEKLEKKRAKEVKKLTEKLIAPVKGLLQRIWDFLKFTFLGAAFNSLMRWISDPKNARKVEVLTRLLKTFWPALLAAFLLFMTPFGSFVRSTIKLVGFFAKGMAKIMPMLLAALRNLKLTAGGRLTGRGKVAAAAGIFMAGAAIPALFPGTVDSQERKTEAAPGSKDAKIKKLKEEKAKVGWFDPWGKKAEIDEQIYRLQTGKTKGYARGGKIFSGFVGSDTGTTVTGAGEDTQLLPVEGGGSAVLSQGELVLTEEQQQRMADETGVDPAKFVVGGGGSDISGALRPVGGPDALGVIRSQTQGFSKGGIIGSGKVTPTSSGTPQSTKQPNVSLWAQLSRLIKEGGKFKDIFTPKEENPQATNPLVNQVWKTFVSNSFKNKTGDFWKSPQKSSAKPTPAASLAPVSPTPSPISTPKVQKKQHGGVVRVGKYAGGGAIAPAQLGAIVGGADPKKINPVYQKSLPLLFQILQGGRWKDRGWGTKNFMQMLTARMMQESHNFTKTKELADVSPSDPKGKPGWNYFNKIRGYGSNPALGNKGDADGYNFIGRGPVQLTGRANYEMFNKWLQRNGYKGYDVLKNPGLIEKDPKVQALSVLAYLENRQKLFPGANLAQMAKEGNLKDFVYSINGGHHGLDVTQRNLRGIQSKNVMFNYGPAKTSQMTVTKPAPKQNWVQRLLGNRGTKPAATSTPKPAAKPSAPAAKPARAWYDPRGWVGKQEGGRMVTEDTGLNIPGATADRQLVALQPGENHYILPKKFVDLGGVSMVDQLVAKFDPNSAPAKDGVRSTPAQMINQVNRNVPGPPVRASLNNVALPPIKQTGMSGPLGAMDSMDTTGSEVPIFSAVAGSGVPERSRLCEIYGIVG